MAVTIRTARLEDAAAIARVDLETHIEAYRPILGDDYPRDATLEETAERWQRILIKARLGLTDEVLVAEHDGVVVAYSSVGPSRDADGAGRGEVYTLYVHPGEWRSGLGCELLATATRRLRALGYPEVTLWVLEPNAHARAFYESQGWRHDGTTEPARGRPFRNLRYRAPAEKTSLPGAELGGSQARSS